MNESLNIEWTIKTVDYFESDGAMKTGTLTFNTIIQIRSILFNIKNTWQYLNDKWHLSNATAKMITVTIILNLWPNVKVPDREGPASCVQALTRATCQSYSVGVSARLLAWGTSPRPPRCRAVVDAPASACSPANLQVEHTSRTAPPPNPPTSRFSHDDAV